MSSRLASQRPMPIPGMGAPDMEPNVSHSPIELPTPPDEVALGADNTRRHASGKDSAGVLYPLFARRSSFEKGMSSPLASLYRTPQWDHSASSTFRYAGFRPFGVSSFQMSAERRSGEQEEAVEDTDMSVDDVFSASSQRDDRRVRVADMEAVDLQEPSPVLGPHYLDHEDNIPPLDASSAGGRAPVPVPSAPGSLSSRRSSFRSIGSPAESAGLAMTPGPSSRRVPYSVPSRSPGPMGPLSHAYAMSMTPSNGVSRARVPQWASSRSARRTPSRSVALSTSAPSQHAMFAFDDDETDEDSGLPDDDATEDEGEPYGRRGSYTGPSRSPSPPYSSECGYEDEEAVTRARSRSRPREDARYAYAGVRAAPHGFPYARNTPLGQPTRPGIRAHTPYATSLPARVDRHARGLSTYEPGWPVEDSKQRTQVQMAAAALDRLSMAADVDEKRAETSELPRSIDENDEVAAIRDRLGGAANCSAFISKLWHLMINPDLYGKYIHWSEGGDTIILSNDPDVSAEFASEILPKLFKHGNNASFVRQLNLYGFQRVSSSRLLDAAELQAIAAKGLDRGERAPFDKAPTSYNTAAELYGAHSSFAHPRFRRGQETWLASMKPRSSKKPKRTAEEGK